MKKNIKKPTSQLNKSLSNYIQWDDGTTSALTTAKKPFTYKFKNMKIKFNPRPIRKNRKSENKQKSRKQDRKRSYSKIAREIDFLLKKPIETTQIQSAGKVHNQMVNGMDDDQHELKDTTPMPLGEKTEITNGTICEAENLLDKEGNDELYPISTKIQTSNKHDPNIKLIDERNGFGWKGLGSRKIVFDDTKKDYRYEIMEPHLDESEEAIKDKIIYWFRTRADLDVFDMDKNEKMHYLEEALKNIVKENNIKLEPESKDRVFYHIFRDFLGYGKIDILMHDEEIEDISCDGHGIPIFIFHITYESIPSNIVFNEADALDSFVVKLSQICGKQISVYEPVVDGKLSDGSRLQTTLARTVTHHSTFTIRKFRENPLTPVDLIANNTMSAGMAAYFWMAIEQSSSILFCGGTATGKTTMLNALSLFLPLSYKIVSIEDTREINLPHENWIAGTTRKGFSSTEAAKTAKDIDMFDLIRVALRQRPRAIIVGEVRGKEAYTLFQAMTTGHLSYSTVHASNLHALIQRLENPPISLPRALLTSLDLVVFLNNVTVKGTPVRRITDVTEIIKLDPETNRLVTMTPFRWISEIDDQFETNGGSSILTRIKIQNGWNNDKLHQEINNRTAILKWMQRKNLRSYEEVGGIVSKYRKDPESVLKKISEDS